MSIHVKLVSIGPSDPVPTPLVKPDISEGVHFALVGNIWNTNYPFCTSRACVRVQTPVCVRLPASHLAAASVGYPFEDVDASAQYRFQFTFSASNAL